MPPRAGGSLDPGGPVAAEIAELWWILLCLGAGVFVLFMFVLIRGLLRRESEGVSDRSGLFLVVGGVIMPTILVAVVFAVTLIAMRAIPSSATSDPIVVEVTGHQWWWEISYPDLGIRTANELHIPVGREIELRLTSADVVHSFWVPALAGKLDLLPDRVNTLILQADLPGNYTGMCAEFCGLQHANMAIEAVAERQDSFERWVAQQGSAAAEPVAEMAVEGAEVFLSAGCADCHTIRGTPASGDRGPDLTHLASRGTLGSGVLDNNPESLRDWISDPQAHKEGIAMEDVGLTPNDLDALVAYLGTLE